MFSGNSNEDIWIPPFRDGEPQIFTDLTEQMFIDSMLLVDDVNHPIKRTYKIDVGEIPDHMVEEYIKKLTQQIKRNPYDK